MLASAQCIKFLILLASRRNNRGSISDGGGMSTSADRHDRSELISGAEARLIVFFRNPSDVTPLRGPALEYIGLLDGQGRRAFALELLANIA